MTLGECPSWTLPSYVDDKGRPYPACSALHELVLQSVKKYRPGLVILSSSSLEVQNATRPEIHSTSFAIAHDGVSRSISALRAAGAQRVVVLSPPPSLKNLTHCVTRFGSPSSCVARPERKFRDDVAGESQAAAELKAPYIRTEDWFCVQGACPAFVGRTPVTADGAHLTIEYARSLGRLMRAALLEHRGAREAQPPNG